ncbi:MAG TPA: DUF3667 domain-containing protein [Mucilaginibacter sp.]|nr:DUF3667 domain-containing protein [Mucilaginibacter sp.]
MKKHYRKENNCLNCGTTLEGKYCHNCGQENLEIKESFGHMMNHAISDYFHFDHQFFHTLKPLLFKPGYLTNEYMAGRRAQYLHPVKMYIFISLVYFVLLLKSGHDVVKINQPDNPAASKTQIDSIKTAIGKNKNLSTTQKKVILDNLAKDSVKNVKTDKVDQNYKEGFLTMTADTSYQQYLMSQKKLPKGERDGWFGRLYNKKAFDYKERYGNRSREVLFEEFRHNIPKMMFLALPLFALILKFTFWKSKKFYVEHLIYAFHLHCFIFIFLAFIMLLQLIIPMNKSVTDWLNGLVMLYVIWYIYKSLRVVYKRSRFRTITKFLGMSVMYFAVFTLCVSIVFILTALSL